MRPGGQIKQWADFGLCLASAFSKQRGGKGRRRGGRRTRETLFRRKMSLQVYFPFLPVILHQPTIYLSGISWPNEMQYTLLHMNIK